MIIVAVLAALGLPRLPLPLAAALGATALPAEARFAAAAALALAKISARESFGAAALAAFSAATSALLRRVRLGFPLAGCGDAADFIFEREVLMGVPRF